MFKEFGRPRHISVEIPRVVRYIKTLNKYSQCVLRTLLFLAAAWPSTFPSPSFGQPTNGANQEQYVPLPLSINGEATGRKILDRYNIPFVEGTLPLDPGGSARVNVGLQTERIFFLGMTDTDKPLGANSRKGPPRGPGELLRPTTPLNAWADPNDASVHFFVGDQLGQIRLDYADGSTQVFPLILGQGVWWGRIFYDYPEPFPTDSQLRKALASALRLYPPEPVKDGNYVAVIQPRNVPIRSITVENSSAKKGSLLISGITVETTDTNGIAGTTVLSAGDFPPEFAEFVKEKSLRALGQDEKQAGQELDALRLALYSSDESFTGTVAPGTPPGYSGPSVLFKGSLSAQVLANAFAYNVQDIVDKIGEDGMYHTSTKGALSWGSYKGFGTYRTNLSRYCNDSYSRDMGRSLQEITALGYTNKALRCADYSLQMARLWETNPSLKINDTFLPRHWGQLVNRPSKSEPEENDGHGLTTLFLYKLWQRLPNRDDWLRSHWPDVKGAGDWILWQFAHPEISGATNGVLHTTGESANGNGYSVYPDSICMTALRALAQMADSIGETNSAAQWRERADKMQASIPGQYAVNDPKYGRVWRLDYANWPNKSTVLGPLIFLADYQGFAPEDEDDAWRSVNEATYQRLIDTYPPLGFYGQAMGYGQGFVTESALLLDRMHEATKMLNWTAREIYDPRFDCYIVPEGLEIDPTGRFWYRIGDLGNGVQEGEIVKALRLVIGVDDTHPNRLQFFPRMPFDWNEMAVEKYPVVFESSGKMETALLRYQLKRTGNGMKLQIASNEELGTVAMRLGPFERQPEAADISVNGKSPAGMSVEHSGDSWWARFTMTVGPAH